MGQDSGELDRLLLEQYRTEHALPALYPRLALLYGSVPKGTDTASSDVDLLVVGDELTLEDLYAVLAAVDTSLDRKINPTLYTSKEFDQRRNAGNAFLMRVLAGKHMVLIGEEHARFATR